MTDARHQHPSIILGDNLRAIANDWPALLARLGGTGGTDQTGIRTAPSSRPTIDPHVSDIKHEVEDWMRFLARTLIDETDWTPPDDRSTPSMLRDIARWRTGHFTEHDDQLLAQAVSDDADRLAGLVHRTAYPAGVRKIPLHVPCLEHDTDDQGQRVPCPGQYHTLLIPHRGDLQDMVCNHDHTHRMSPWEWQRGVRSGRINPQPVRRGA